MWASPRTFCFFSLKALTVSHFPYPLTHPLVTMKSPSQHRQQRDQRDEGDRSQRLQKVLAMAGVGSRRECEELILEGRVEIDREVVTELGVRVDLGRSEVRLDGEVVRIPKMIYVLVNKPTGVVTTNADPEGRPRVIDLVRSDYRLFPVGRLDRTSEGLILLTNDGELGNQLTHPRYGVTKTYQVVVAGSPRHDELQVLCRGVHLAEGLAKAESVTIKKRHRNSTTLEIVLREGKNREIRRLLARVGHKVLRLKRVAQGPLRLGGLAVGDSRPLTVEEVDALRRACRRPRPSSGGAKQRGAKQRGGNQSGGNQSGNRQRKEQASRVKRSGGGGSDHSRSRGRQSPPVRPPAWASTLGAILDYETDGAPAGQPGAGTGTDESQGAGRGQAGRGSQGRGGKSQGQGGGRRGKSRSSRNAQGGRRGKGARGGQGGGQGGKGGRPGKRKRR